jgi:hypothetical protein
LQVPFESAATKYYAVLAIDKLLIPYSETAIDDFYLSATKSKILRFPLPSIPILPV